MIRLASPIIATQYSLVLMQFVDAWMLGTLGSSELAAVTPAGLLIQVLVCFGAGFLTAVVTLAANSFGQRNLSNCWKHGYRGVLASLVFGLLALLLWPLAPTIFRFFDHPPMVMAYETSYFQVSLFSVLPQFVAIASANFFIGVQRTGLAVVGSLVGMASNIIFNYALIFGSFGFPELGFIGAAWGTVIASAIQAFLTVYMMRRWAIGNRISSTTLNSGWGKLFKMGLPAGAQGAVDVLSWGVILTMLIGHFGTEHLAAATILIRCMQISFLPSDGLASALQTMVGEAMGKGNTADAQRYVHAALKLIVSYMVGMGIAFYFGREPIMNFFSDDRNVIEIGIQVMVFVSFFQLFDAFNVTYINALHGVGDTFWPMVVNTLLCIIILLAGGLLMIHKRPDLASFGVWFVASIYIFAQGSSFLIRWQRGKWLGLNSS